MKAPRRGSIATFNSVKVFSGSDRAAVDRAVEVWLARHPRIHLIEAIVTESTTDASTCVCITLFFHEPPLAVIVPVATMN
ncbi:MAG: hypothetical protein HOV81_08725 [Kofleriaceae bacterium]|nr:hypothetical protein [Kofleriaceae bacterium]